MEKVKDMETRLSYQGVRLEQYLQMVGKSMEDFRKEHEENAKTSVKTRLTLEAIVKAENIEASEEDVNAKIEEMAAMYGRPADELKANEQFVTYVKENSDFVKSTLIENFGLPGRVVSKILPRCNKIYFSLYSSNKATKIKKQDL